MHNYFFMSSPLHFCVAVSIALQQRQAKNVAVFVAGTQDYLKKYGDAARESPDIFDDVIFLAKRTGRLNIAVRQVWYKSFTTMFDDKEQINIYTGNDRRPEFQNAMYWLVTHDKYPSAFYMDEGTVTYIGHKSMHTVKHRYIDPLLKRLLYGRWWRNALTTGTSDWIGSAYVAFPQLVHPRLQQKTLLPIDEKAFSSEVFLRLVGKITALDRQQQADLAKVRVILTLPYEAYFLQVTELYRALAIQLRDLLPREALAVKAHPRIKNRQIITDIFPDFQVLDNSIGMELLVPFLNKQCVLVGDISSVLLTAKLLRPNLPILALAQAGSASSQLTEIYHGVGIPMIALSDVGANLKSLLSGGTGIDRQS